MGMTPNLYLEPTRPDSILGKIVYKIKWLIVNARWLPQYPIDLLAHLAFKSSAKYYYDTPPETQRLRNVKMYLKKFKNISPEIKDALEKGIVTLGMNVHEAQLAGSLDGDPCYTSTPRNSYFPYPFWDYLEDMKTFPPRNMTMKFANSRQYATEGESEFLIEIEASKVVAIQRIR